MNQKQVEIIKQQITIHNDRPVTTSLNVAKAFEKRHDNVLRDIEVLDCSEEFRVLNFGETVRERPNPSGGAPIVSRAYEMTKDGFMFLAMGYTGTRAARLKEAWIAAFNAMEAEIRSGMAATREAVANAVIAIVAEAANRGYRASFIPELVQCRQAMLSCEQTGRVLRISSSAVSTWHRKLVDAGVPLPSGKNRSLTTDYFHKMADQYRQLALPGLEAK